MSTRILFVDDEANILQGLRRMLWPLRQDWDMRFASSGQEALDLIDEAPCEVIVSDMRMPGMDGVSLLHQVRAKHPEVIRIVLSGQADRQSTLAAVGPAHQYLSKPCDAKTLRDTIDRAVKVRERISSPAIVSLVSKVSTLSSVPSVYLDLKNELESENGSAAKAAEIIAGDAAMTAKILQVVNSAFFGVRREIVNPIDAVRLLGFDVIRALVLSAGVFGRPADTRVASLTEQLWRHSFTTSAYARVIARAEDADAKAVDLAVTAGLLHDVGKLVLATCFGDDYLRLCRDQQQKAQPLWQVEQAAYGATHAEVGGHLLSLWSLPDSITEVVFSHHQPSEFVNDDVAALTAVHVANSLAHRGAGNDVEGHLNSEFLELHGLCDRVHDWEHACREADNGIWSRLLFGRPRSSNPPGLGGAG